VIPASLPPTPVIVMLESAGIPMPGETILVTAAVYAGTRHALDIRWVIAAAAGGAILGDNIGFWVGREFGDRNAILGLNATSTEISTKHLREVLATSVTRAGAEVFDPRLSLCANNKCIYQVDGISIYSDNGHIASSQLGLLRNNLRTIMTRP
jgi:hypothetical protein